MGRILKKMEKTLKKLELFIGKGPWKIKLGRSLLEGYDRFHLKGEIHSSVWSTTFSVHYSGAEIKENQIGVSDFKNCKCF